VQQAIETFQLCKSFGSIRAVDALTLEVRQGEIYGFLGRNGAGKTTTIRTLLGMVRPTSGSVRILGVPVGPSGLGPWRLVGHLVERPAAYPELSVRENLEVSRRLYGVDDRQAVARAIERLGLEAEVDRRAGVLSTGNLQRLALARALLHAPEILILDEPANGLDPAGVVEIRDLLAGLAREQGVTVFMSSHILSEVDRLATRIGIIHKGRLVEELDARDLEGARSRRLEIQVRRPEAARLALIRAGYAVDMRQADGVMLLKEARALDAPDEVAKALVEAGSPPLRLAIEQEDLEEHFLRLTGGPE
jgi:ABC-2 type transport system ATP-binding protein